MSNQMTYRSLEELPMLLTVAGLMPVLGIGRNKAYELVRSGEIESFMIGNQYRIPREAVAEFISASAT